MVGVFEREEEWSIWIMEMGVDNSDDWRVQYYDGCPLEWISRSLSMLIEAWSTLTPSRK